MQTSAIDMVNGNLPRNILRFSLPLIGVAVLQNLYVFCDMTTLGLFAGDMALAAVGATTYLVSLFVNFFIGLSVGVNVVIAQALGAGDRFRVKTAAHTAVASGVFFGFLLLILGFSLSEACLKLMNTPDDIIGLSSLYLKIYFVSAPALVLFHFGAAILRASGNSRSPFIYITAAGIVHIILNLFFVSVCRLHVTGVAMGTGLSQILSAFLILRHLVREDTSVRISLSGLRIEKTILHDILHIGIFTGLNNMLFSFSNAAIQSSINLFGSAAVAGCSASTTIEHFVYAVTNSMMQTAITFSGQNTGAKRYDNVQRVLRWCLIYTSAAGLILGVFVYLAGPVFFPVILSDAASVEYGMLRNRIIMLPYLICGIMEVLSGMLRGLGCAVLPTVVSLAGICGFRVLWIQTVFRAYMSLSVLFLSFPVSWTITAFANLLCYLYAIKKIRRGSFSGSLRF